VDSEERKVKNGRRVTTRSTALRAGYRHQRHERGTLITLMSLIWGEEPMSRGEDGSGNYTCPLYLAGVE